MSKIDDFKKFVSRHPEFATYIKEHKNVSWQTFYELYDMYGENDNIWKKYISNETNLVGVKGLLNALKNINIDSLEENVNSIQKVVSLVDELTHSDKVKEETNASENKINNIYGEDK